MISPFAEADSEAVQFSLGSHRRSSLLGVDRGLRVYWFLSAPSRRIHVAILGCLSLSWGRPIRRFFTYGGCGNGRTHCLLLNGSPSAFAASHDTNSRALGRTTRLNLSYLRDHLSLISFPSFQQVSTSPIQELSNAVLHGFGLNAVKRIDAE